MRITAEMDEHTLVEVIASGLRQRPDAVEALGVDPNKTLTFQIKIEAPWRADDNRAKTTLEIEGEKLCAG